MKEDAAAAAGCARVAWESDDVSGVCLARGSHAFLRALRATPLRELCNRATPLRERPRRALRGGCKRGVRRQGLGARTPPRAAAVTPRATTPPPRPPRSRSSSERCCAFWRVRRTARGTLTEALRLGATQWAPSSRFKFDHLLARDDRHSNSIRRMLRTGRLPTLT